MLSFKVGKNNVMKNSVFKLGVYLRMKNLKRNLFVLYHLTELVVLRNKKIKLKVQRPES